MIHELTTRFPQELVHFAFLEPKNMFKIDAIERIYNLSTRYPELDADRVVSQYKLIRNEVKSLPNVHEVLLAINKDFNDLLHLYKICLCLPVTTASVERSFSKLLLVSHIFLN